MVTVLIFSLRVAHLVVRAGAVLLVAGLEAEAGTSGVVSEAASIAGAGQGSLGRARHWKRGGGGGGDGREMCKKDEEKDDGTLLHTHACIYMYLQ